MGLQDLLNPITVGETLRKMVSPAVLGMFPTETLEAIKEILKLGIANIDAIAERRNALRENMRAPSGNR